MVLSRVGAKLCKTNSNTTIWAASNSDEGRSTECACDLCSVLVLTSNSGGPQHVDSKLNLAVVTYNAPSVYMNKQLS